MCYSDRSTSDVVALWILSMTSIRGVTGSEGFTDVFDVMYKVDYLHLAVLVEISLWT